MRYNIGDDFISVPTKFNKKGEGSQLLNFPLDVLEGFGVDNTVVHCVSKIKTLDEKLKKKVYGSINYNELLNKECCTNIK